LHIERWISGETVPQVSSDATTAAFKPAPPSPPRAALNSGGAPDLPFDSLLDDSAQAAAAPPAPADTTSNAAQPDSTQPPTNPNGGKAAQTSGNTTVINAIDGGKAVQTAGNTKATNAINAAGVDATAIKSKAVGNTKAKPDAKIAVQAKADDTSKPATDGKAAADSKPADAPAPVALAADPTNNPVQTVTPVVVVAAVPTSGVVIPPPTGRGSQGASVATQPEIVASDAPKPKTADLTAAQSGTDKLAAVHPHDEGLAAAPRASAQTSPVIATDAQATAPKTAGDALQQASLTPPSPDVSPAPANPAVQAAPAPQPGLAASAAAVPIAGIAIEIVSIAQAGKNHFEIRLDPPELGRIEVRLDVDRDGHVTSRLIADRSDTLDLLRRDATGLERALQDAGLKTADNGLQFSLRDQTTGSEQGATPAPSAAQIVVQDNTLPINDMTQRNYSRLAGLRGGIDIRV
jgi:flagellar hook-length control protein FliK